MTNSYNAKVDKYIVDSETNPKRLTQVAYAEGLVCNKQLGCLPEKLQPVTSK